MRGESMEVLFPVGGGDRARSLNRKHQHMHNSRPKMMVGRRGDLHLWGTILIGCEVHCLRYLVKSSEVVGSLRQVALFWFARGSQVRIMLAMLRRGET